MIELCGLYCFSDLSDIYARLFDHRPSLQGEISYFVREFEVILTEVYPVNNVAYEDTVYQWYW